MQAVSASTIPWGLTVSSAPLDSTVFPGNRVQKMRLMPAKVSPIFIQINNLNSNVDRIAILLHASSQLHVQIYAFL